MVIYGTQTQRDALLINLLVIVAWRALCRHSQNRAAWRQTNKQTGCFCFVVPFGDNFEVRRMLFRAHWKL